jgi:tetratricopeptide (TPR) repeat protein
LARPKTARPRPRLPRRTPRPHRCRPRPRIARYVAIPRLEAKIKANPSDKESLQDLAGYYLGAGRNEQALALTQRLISLGVKTAQVYFLDGVANQSLGRIKAATDDFEQATTQEPTNAQILLTLTNLYLQTNRSADAERVAKRATTFNPTDKRVWENYGLVLAKKASSTTPAPSSKPREKLDPKDATPIVLEARSYVSQKAIALAAADFDRALTIDPKSPDALLGKASLEAGNHDVKGSIVTFEQLLAVETTDDAKASVMVQEYQVYRDEKMNDDALGALKRAETAYPNVPAVHIAYGDYDVSIGKDQSAGMAEWNRRSGPRTTIRKRSTVWANSLWCKTRRAMRSNYFKRLAEVVPNDPGVLGKLGQVQAANNQYGRRARLVRAIVSIAAYACGARRARRSGPQLKNYKECARRL